MEFRVARFLFTVGFEAENYQIDTLKVGRDIWYCIQKLRFVVLS